MCDNDKPKIIYDRGYKTFCCEEHAQQHAQEVNAKKSNKLSKSQQRGDNDRQ